MKVHHLWYKAAAESGQGDLAILQQRNRLISMETKTAKKGMKQEIRVNIGKDLRM